MSIEYLTGYRTVAVCDDCGLEWDSGWGDDSATMPPGWVAMPQANWGMTSRTVACSLACAEALALRMARDLYAPETGVVP